MASRSARAQSYGGVADHYDRARPAYPVEAVSWLLGPRGLDVVEVGAGTGKLTAVLRSAGHRLVAAVEPLAQLRAKLGAALPEVPVVSGRAEEPLPDRCADAVVVGQAFNWFDAEAAVEEAARVLRARGVLGLLWNFREDSQAWMRELTAIAGQDVLREGWNEELAATPPVASIERRDFRLEHHVDRDRLLGLVSSWSYVATLDDAERRRVLARVEDLWDGHPGLAGAQEAVLAYRTEAYRVLLGHD
ncbi:MAG TPA: methyltransferase domain-containing protein [Thermoleophilaceae bacterium]|nr:methyltransferase domain-containing protein [Thermoleophilaceae bacterium]